MQTARESMCKAAEEIRRGDLGAEYDNDMIVGTTASFDGSWQRRGFASLNGVVTAISHGKCVDMAVLSKKCGSCKRWETKKGTPEYDEWKENHECTIK